MWRKNVTPHVAQNVKRPGGTALDARTTWHAGYAVSQRKRKRIEESFWLKTIALMRKAAVSFSVEIGVDRRCCAAAPYILKRSF